MKLSLKPLTRCIDLVIVGSHSTKREPSNVLLAVKKLLPLLSGRLRTPSSKALFKVLDCHTLSHVKEKMVEVDLKKNETIFCYLRFIFIKLFSDFNKHELMIGIEKGKQNNVENSLCQSVA